MSLLNIPKVSLCLLLTEWLELEAVARVDSADCKTSARGEFLALLASNSCTFQKICCSEKPSPFQWAVGRKLSFLHVEIQTPVLERSSKLILSAFGAKLRSLTLNFVTEVPERAYLRASCTFVVSLGEEIWSDVSETCNGLQDLTVTSNVWWAFADGSSAFNNFVSAFPHLVHLTNYERLTNDMLQAICVSPSLESLTLHRCRLPDEITVPERNTRITSVESSYPSNAAAILVLFPALQKIHSSRVSLPYLCLEYSQLTHLCLGQCYLLPANTLRLIADSLVHLVDLNILIEHSSTYYHARWKECDMIYLNSKLSALHTLRYLEDRYCEHNQTIGKDIARHHLVYPVGYSGSRLTTICINLVEENTLKHIVDNCPYLYALHLWYPHEHGLIYPDSITSLQRLSNSTIRVLRMSHYSTSPDTCLLPLYHMQLYELDILLHPTITNDNVLDFMRNVSSIRSIGIKSCKLVTGDLVIQLLQQFPQLRKLGYISNKLKQLIIFNSRNISVETENIIHYLAKIACPNMESLLLHC